MSSVSFRQPLPDRIVRSVGDRLTRWCPRLERPLVGARDRYARARIRARTTVNAARYAAPPEPYRLLRVDPGTVERGLELASAKYLLTGVIADGDWDREGYRFTDLDVYRAYARHFEEGVPWEETEFYDRIVDELADGSVRWGCRTEAEFRGRCDRLDELYERLRTDGYRSQAELLAEEGSDPIDGDRHSELLIERLKDEISVHIDRNGELVFADGRNRLSMAKLIGLDSVTVRVLVRHADWQAVRDGYVHGEPWAADYGGHPDLASLTFGSKASRL